MLIKKVNCDVHKGMEKNFSKGQERWADLRECKGFIAQYGGWSNNKIANIIAFWDDSESYHHFIHHDHDVIYSRANQKESIESIHVQMEDIHVQDIDQFATEWLNHVGSLVNEKWTITKPGGKK